MGTVFGATTAGTRGEAEGDEPPIRFRGDEADLFLAFNPELQKSIAARVHGLSRQDIEDACDFAWIQFFRYQPSRNEQRWQGWLIRTAQREAWKLSARQSQERSISPGLNAEGRPVERELADPRDRVSERLEYLAALDELRRLPKMMQRVVIVRSQVHRQQDVADILGVSLARVNRLLVDVSLRLNELNERRTLRERPVASPRAARLRELEDEPPTWLQQAIGKAPTRNRSNGAALLAWRRAALMIDDYRGEHGWASKDVAIGPRPEDPRAGRAYDRATHAASQAREERTLAYRGGRQL